MTLHSFETIVRRRLAYAVAAVTLCVLASPGEAQKPYRWELFGDGFNAPVQVAQAPGDTRTLAVAEQAGRIRLVVDGEIVDDLIDLTPVVQLTTQSGIQSFVFHPDYGNRGWFYVYYHSNETNGSQLWRYRVPDPYSYEVDPASGVMLIGVEDEIAFHHGGGMDFGPDGMLYLAIGDRRLELEGDGCTAQDGSRLIGKILRLEDDGQIPPNNPFVGVPEVRDEIWGFGVRQPFRMSFDRENADLYLGDVGEFTREEFSVIPWGPSSPNLGWRVLEGSVCSDSIECAAFSCEDTSFIAPAFDYGHSTGCCAIGGTVYRGTALPELEGTYLFSDWCSGQMSTFRWNGSAAQDFAVITEDIAPETGSIIRPTSIGMDNNGEFYLTDMGSFGSTDEGELYRLVRRPLAVDTYEISLATGGTQNMALAAGSKHAGDFYLVLGTITGTSPGVPLGDLLLPLNPDPYFDLTQQLAAPITDGVGTLDASGEAQASLVLPAEQAAALAGLTAHHAYLLFDPEANVLVFASNSEQLQLLP